MVQWTGCARHPIPQRGQAVRITTELGRLALASLWSTPPNFRRAGGRIDVCFLSLLLLTLLIDSFTNNNLLRDRNTAQSTARLYKAKAATLRPYFISWPCDRFFRSSGLGRGNLRISISICHPHSWPFPASWAVFDSQQMLPDRAQLPRDTWRPTHFSFMQICIRIQN